MVAITSTLLTLAMTLASAVAVPASTESTAKLTTRATGEITYFNPALGACGETNGDGDAVAALAASLFDAERPCNRNIRVSYEGRSMTVRVVDRCQACVGNDVDLSPSAFQQVIGDLGLGRVQASWEWA
ncbi:lytic transglycosylase [Hirsutella rhossiliensis]|uniref:Lytic transglycosylase domain-containing protein n=1 Tax=Hirsutella rhossiliensis TaxID=111463 RepID=A0A9P8N4D8_9HYPO|nr:lytic transglycosylase domain-containing protein [Hirsutella rhossiliensis]KAH0968198.1 lytic transglycosylase domain-containing protein [Hirsutella rhossiliensis]